MKRKIVYFFWCILLPFALTGCSHESAVSEPHSEAELSGLTLATSNGTYYQIKYSKREDVKLYVANIETDAIQAVRQGKADVYVSDEVMLTSEDQKRLGMKMAFRGEECFDVAFALKKGNMRSSLQRRCTTSRSTGLTERRMWRNLRIRSTRTPSRCIALRERIFLPSVTCATEANGKALTRIYCGVLRIRKGGSL